MRKGLAAAGVVALISAGSAACGADTPASPQGKVNNAFQKLGKQNTVTVGLGFTGTADQIYAAMKDEDGFTRDDAKLLASLNVKLAASSQKSFSVLGHDLAKSTKDSKDASVAFVLSSDDAGGAGLVEVRGVGQKVYLRADVKGLEKLDTDASDSGDIAQINQFLDSADQLPASLASVKAALKGQWVSIDPKAWTDFIKSAGGGDSSSTASPTPTLDPKTQNQLVTGLRAALTKDAVLTDEGSRNGADHIKVTVPAQAFTKDVATDLAPALKQIPGFKQSDLTDAENAKGVPNKKVSADIAIKNGTLSAITLDLAQLDTESTGPLPLTLTFDGSAKPVSAPAGAQQLNPQDVIGLVMANMNKSGDNSDDSML